MTGGEAATSPDPSAIVDLRAHDPPEPPRLRARRTRPPAAGPQLSRPASVPPQRSPRRASMLASLARLQIGSVRAGPPTPATRVVGLACRALADRSASESPRRSAARRRLRASGRPPPSVASWRTRRPARRHLQLRGDGRELRRARSGRDRRMTGPRAAARAVQRGEGDIHVPDVAAATSVSSAESRNFGPGGRRRRRSTPHRPALVEGRIEVTLQLGQERSASSARATTNASAGQPDFGPHHSGTEDMPTSATRATARVTAAPGHLSSVDGSRATLRALPKAELHQHLDGSVRPATAVELAAETGLALTLDEARRRMVAPQRCRTRPSCSASSICRSRCSRRPMRSGARRVELVEDARGGRDHVRGGPLGPPAPSRARAIGQRVIEAVASGRRRRGARLGPVSPFIALIVTALRSHPPGANVELARTAAAFGPPVSDSTSPGPRPSTPRRRTPTAFVAAREAGPRAHLPRGRACRGGSESARRSTSA